MYKMTICALKKKKYLSTAYSSVLLNIVESLRQRFEVTVNCDGIYQEHFCILILKEIY